MIIVGTIGQSDLIDKAGVDLSPIKNKKKLFCWLFLPLVN